MTTPSALQAMVEFARNVSQDNDNDCNGWATPARAALDGWGKRPRLRDQPELVRAVADAVLYDLEDRRDVKRPLTALKHGDATDRRIYNEIRTAIGALALDALEPLLYGERG